MCARWCRSICRRILGSVARTHRLFTVEENPRLCGWGAEIVSIVADEAFYDLDGPPVRITTPHIPLPAADILEDIALPTVDRIVERVRARWRPDRRAIVRRPSRGTADLPACGRGGVRGLSMRSALGESPSPARFARDLSRKR